MSPGQLSAGGAVLEGAALVVGFMAAAIAVGAFIGRSLAVLFALDDDRVQQITILGGLGGLAVALIVIGVDQVAG